MCFVCIIGTLTKVKSITEGSNIRDMWLTTFSVLCQLSALPDLETLMSLNIDLDVDYKQKIAKSENKSWKHFNQNG